MRLPRRARAGSGVTPPGASGLPPASGRRLWPDERQAALLQAGLAPPPTCVEAWRRLAGELDVARLDPGAARLLPLVWRHLRRHGVEDARLDRLEPRYCAARAAGEALLGALGQVLEALHAAGVPTVVLKGGALLVSAYGDPGERPMSDVDILVPPELISPAARTLERRGWRPQSPLTAAVTQLGHSVSFVRAGHTPVDLHWHVFEECCRPGDDDELWRASVPVTLGGVRTRVPAPEDLLLHVCVHGEKWVHVPGIRWIADAVVLLRRGGVGWERLVTEAVRRRFVLRMRAQLGYLASVFAAPVPADALAALGRAPVSPLERFEQRWSIRDRRRPWVLVYWCNHVRSAPGLATATWTFPRYLQAAWRLESLRQVPAAAVARLLRQARAARGRRGSGGVGPGRRGGGRADEPVGDQREREQHPEAEVHRGG